MSLLGIERLATTAVQGLAAAFAPLTQLTSADGAFEATLRGAGAAQGDSGVSEGSPEELSSHIESLKESIRTTLERRLAAAGVALDAPLELERNAFGQWSLVDGDSANRVAVEQALSELPPDFMEKLTEYRRALARQDEMQGGFSLANLIDQRDGVRVTVSREALVVD